jgi:hypothetical protein
MPRRRFLLPALLALAALLFIGIHLFNKGEHHHINATVCAEIQLGMTRKQVEDLVGVPGGFYNSNPPVLFRDISVDYLGSRTDFWQDSDGILVVEYDERGLANAKSYSAFEGRSGPLTLLFRRLFGP